MFAQVRHRRRCYTRRRPAKHLSSLGTTLQKIDLVRGSIASSVAICRVSISVVIDDVVALVDFQHGLELGVGDDIHSGRQRVTEMNLDAQVALLYQMETGAIALVVGQVKTDEGVQEQEQKQEIFIRIQHKNYTIYYI